jgi:hypothetical protein
MAVVTVIGGAAAQARRNVGARQHAGDGRPVNEAAAQQVSLVRAVEGEDAEGRLLSEEDRGYAGRAAAELVRWQAAEHGERASPEAFVAKRADLLAAKLAERFPKALRALEAMRWRPWIGVLLPVVAFIAGAAAEHIADRHRVNILAFPLLGLLVWNVAVYLLLFAGVAMALATRSSRKPGWLQRQLSGARGTVAGRASGPLAGALARFVLDWTQRSSPLVIERAERVLHGSAAMLALGAIAGLYVRGLVFEYRAGWESTFLDANAVHGILAFFLQPAARLAGLPFPGVDEIATLRWGGGGAGENAARWIHLYAVTAMLVVVVPRLVLAAIAGLREHRLAARFPLSLDEPYFRRVLSGWREVPARVRVAPYAYTPAEAAAEGVRRLAAHLFGDSVQLYSARPVAFGDEDSLAAGASGESRAADLVIALFNLSSTPETENHGAFLDALRAQAQGPVAVLVDESPYRRRLGAQPGTDARFAERRQAWTGLATTRGLRAVFADLETPDLAAVERELDAQFSGVTAAG